MQAVFIIGVILALILILSIIGLAKGIARRLISIFWIVVIALLAMYVNTHNIKSPIDLVQHATQSIKVINKVPDAPAVTKSPQAPETKLEQPETTKVKPVPAPAQDRPEHFVEHLTGTEQSSTTAGSVQWGATILLGELDNGRATWGHILVSDAQEPGQNGAKREPRINHNPTGWRNFKLRGTSYYAFNRGHLLGYQFSGLGDEERNLATITSYLNKGLESNGTNQKNIDSMLYYEQQLDSWLSNHPNFKLDYYVKMLYNGNDVTPHSVYMQWVGIDQNGQTIPINIGGNSANIIDNYYAVQLKNVSPSFEVDYSSNPVQIIE